MKTPLVQVEELSVHFPVSRLNPFAKTRVVQAVTNVSLEIQEGEILGLVGETGCGKSTLGRAVLGLLDGKRANMSGRVLYLERDLLMLPYEELRLLRQKLGMVYQNPLTSLNPRLTAGGNMAVALRNFGYSDTEVRHRVQELTALVGLSEEMENRFPHEFSGGQRQRIGIARALATSPKFIVADEPIASLDVSIQAQILRLLLDLRERLGLTILFISHDLRAVRYLSDRIAVMYLGKVMELGSADDIVHHPTHPYTRFLVSAIPETDPDAKRERMRLDGELPSPLHPPGGCVFSTRCPHAENICQEEIPPLLMHNGNYAACHRLGEISSS